MHLLSTIKPTQGIKNVPGDWCENQIMFTPWAVDRATVHLPFSLDSSPALHLFYLLVPVNK